MAYYLFHICEYITCSGMQLAQCLGPWGGLRSDGKREGAQPGVKGVGEPNRKAPSRGCLGVVIAGVGEAGTSCVWNSKG